MDTCPNLMVGSAGAVSGKRTTELKRIEKLSARQVTFAKRRKGLFKKAHEIATLCDAEIAVILFSSTGKLYEFSSSRMTQVIQRHKLYSKHAQNQKPEQTCVEIEMKDATDSTEDIRRNTSEPPMEWKKLERQCGRLKEENSTLKAKEATLKEENERLRRQVGGSEESSASRSGNKDNHPLYSWMLK
ncbi:MADS-box transcription factor 47-like protein, partial [Drosera capensis]